MKNIYESVETYAAALHIPYELAEKRFAFFEQVKKKTKLSQKCPKCYRNTLVFKGDYWDDSNASYVICENDKVKSKDDEGQGFFESCDFTVQFTDKYYFAYGYDFDLAMLIAKTMDVKNEVLMLETFGTSWLEMVEGDTNSLIERG